MKRDDWLFWLGIGITLALSGTGVYMLTRGFRNNNPGNLKYGTPWVGVTGQDSEGYAIFDTLENGIRALGKDLRAKIGRGVNTVRSIISIYAPSNENPTENYITQVSMWSGYEPDDPIPDTPGALMDVAGAMIRFENGRAAPVESLADGIMLAFNT
jgi:hypothetical protein